ncbi:ISL3 family transposase [Streptosporangium sp. KLBMP 9127]|nr:ISL3 family transposase [Streptosporangium sp. KLBMP 9127]
MLLPHLAGVEVERVEQTAGGVWIWARTRSVAVTCPGCGSSSSRTHSRYRRRLADTAVGGREATIVLQVRRLFCDEMPCDRKTFAEQVPGPTVRHGRKTPLLVEFLRNIAVAVAGRAGARLAGALRAAASRSTLLRLVMAIPDPAAHAPRVLGVDDFAIKRGHRYGTVLIDCETGAPLELLEGRDAAVLADWLTAHPDVEVICRDRSGAYAEGARTGAPQAIQVADRWHLWANLVKAVDKCVAAHRSCLPEPVLEEPGGVREFSPVTPPDPVPPEPTGKFAERARRHHAQVHALLAEGYAIRAIARHLGWGRHTVQRYARAATWQELVDGRWQAPRASMLDPFKPHRHQRLDEGCSNFAELFREIRALGYTGSYSNLRDHLAGHRPAKAPLAAPPPTVREVTGWLTRHPDSLTEDERPPAQSLAGTLSRTGCRRPARSRLCRHAHPADRPRSPPMDQRHPLRRPVRHLLLRQGLGTGPRRRHCWADQPLELRPRRGPRQPHQDDQTADVRPRRASAATQTGPAHSGRPCTHCPQRRRTGTIPAC